MSNGYKSEMAIEEKKKGLKVHGIVYVLVSILLVVINLSFTSEFLWFVFPLAGMGFGLFMHYLLAIKLGY